MIRKKLNIGEFFRTDMECPVCSSQERRILSNIGGNIQSLETVICTGCGLVHSNPIPSKSDLDEFYRQKYRTSYKSSSKPKLKHTLRYAFGALVRVEALLKYKKPEQIKLVDIGSGSGEFLYMASKAGFDVHGIEPHSGYCEYTKQDLGLKVNNTTLEGSNLEIETIDIINLNHVLEHMPAPLETLSRLHALLKEDGILMVDVPDISLCIHAPWTQFHFAHIYNFSPATLKALVEKAGFEILNTETEGTNIIARKSFFAKMNTPRDLSENYQNLWQKLNTHTTIEHYKSKKPYFRFIRKCYQYPKEFLVVALYRSPKKILDQVYSSECQKIREISQKEQSLPAPKQTDY